jgi:UDP-N-acetylglucosamine 2-epimerase
VAKGLGEIGFKRRRSYRRIFSGERGICLIHGDTLTTLISLLYAKRCGIEVAHIEAGLRSYSLFDPFPEELIRLITMRYSDVLFAPSDWGFENLRNMGYAAKTVQVDGNTVAEAICYARKSHPAQQRTRAPYVVATAHRLETLYSRSRMTKIVSLLERIANERQVLFVVHEPTRRQLTRLGLDKRLRHHGSIEILPLQPYFEFINLLADADFVVTDGGSIQEESYFLDVPCLILRTRTERLEGLNHNALLAEFDEGTIDRFLRTFASLRRAKTNHDVHPSRAIVDRLLEWA